MTSRHRAILACGLALSIVQVSSWASSDKPVACDAGDGGLTLPSGFCASIFADNLGHARHIVAAPNGDLYVNTSSSMSNEFTNAPGGFVIALRDADKDGHAEITQRFGTTFQAGKPGGGTGIGVFNNHLYVEVDDKIVKYSLAKDNPVPTGDPAVVLSGLPMDGDHTAHAFAIAPDGALYVNSGSATNSCQEKNRTLESPGEKPCAELDRRAGVWKYDANKTNQTFSPAERIVTGARNTLALAVHDGALYGVIHGRDQLSDNWPKLYTSAQNNELPAEILARLAPGQDYGWPYCYYDASQEKAVLAPEYGGDGGKAEGDCASKTQPIAAFPAHWAPEAIVFATGSGFPESHRNGAFVSFHGSWNRTPAQQGFRVVFVPFSGGTAAPHKDFATGFTGTKPPADSKDAAQAPHRPMGLAIGPDGSLYVSDDIGGRIWKITAATK